MWHDRAVFHFLTAERDRELYLENLRRALKNKGHFIIAAFAEDGALKCSGLEVQRYGLKELQETLGENFRLLQSFREQHQTPLDTKQSFIYAHFQIEK